MSPRYRDVKSDQIPIVERKGRTQIKIICGSLNNLKCPGQDIVIDSEYLDILALAGSSFEHPTKLGNTVLAYVISGKGFFARKRSPLLTKLRGQTILILTERLL